MTIRSLRTTFFAAGAVFLLTTGGRASNGLKPYAPGTRALGRGGSDIAWPTGSATSMYSNPAVLSVIKGNQLDVAPILYRINATYNDSRNGGVPSDDVNFPYVNWAAAFNFWSSDREILEDLKRPDYARPIPRFPEPEPLNPIFGYGKILHRSITIPVTKMPRSVTVAAGGRVAEIYDIAVVANYPGGDLKLAYSNIVASQGSRTPLTDQSRNVAEFRNIVNPLPDPPNEIVVYFTLEVEFKSSGDSADVRVILDGAEQGSSRADWSDVRPESRTPATERKGPELSDLERETSPITFGIGTFVQAGAGADFQIKTALYPEGATHASLFDFSSLAPTVSIRLSDSLSLGLSLYVNYAKMHFETPITQPASLMQGALFPSGSLDAALGGVFGIPTQFGPAMKYVFDTSPKHAPGTSITHSDKPDDPSFASVTGMSRVTSTSSWGLGGRLGLYADVTPRLKVGLTGTPPSFMQNYRGHATINFDHQIAAFVANPTYGHSNEVSVLGIPTELRFTFNQVWNNGTVDVWTAPFGTPILTIPNFPLPSGPIVSNLPNGGTKGWAADYDFEINNFQLPADVGIGFSYLLFDWMRIGIDYRHIFWAVAMKNFETVLTNGTNADVNALIGSTTINLTIPENWSDQNIIAVGLEFYPNDWLTLRCGWNYGNNPVPQETMLPIVPAIAVNHLTAGFSIQLGSVSIDAAYSHTLSTTLTVAQSMQTPDLDSSSLTVSGDIVSIGATWDF